MGLGIFKANVFEIQANGCLPACWSSESCWFEKLLKNLIEIGTSRCSVDHVRQIILHLSPFGRIHMTNVGRSVCVHTSLPDALLITKLFVRHGLLEAFFRVEQEGFQ